MRITPLRLAILFALLVILMPLYVFQGFESTEPTAFLGMDFRTFHESARLYRATGDLYPEHRVSEMPNLNNPHTTVAFFVPLAGLSYRPAFAAYAVLSFAIMLAGLPFLVAAVRAERFASIALTVMLLASVPTYLSAQKGQLGVILILPLAFALWAMIRGRPGWAGAALGVAFSIKFFVGLFLPTLVLARRWKAAATMFAVTVAIYGLGALVFGWDQYLRHFGMLGEQDHIFYGLNASLLGTVSRLVHGVSNGSVPVTHPLHVLVAGPVALSVFVGACKARTPGQLFGLTIVGMLLLSPLAWHYYMPLTVIPMVVAWEAGGWIRWAAVPAWVLLSLPAILMPLSFHTAGLLLLLLVMLKTVSRAEEEAPRQVTIIAANGRPGPLGSPPLMFERVG